MSRMIPARFGFGFCFTLVFSVAMSSMSVADGPSLLRMFSRAKPMPVDASKAHELTEEDGPWMILAHTFVGPGSRERAERLVIELRRDLNLPAFVYREDFDFSGEVRSGNPVQRAGGYQRKMKYANEIRYEAHAVLVGEYDNAEHPKIDDDLVKIKTAKCAVFGDKKEMEAENDLRNPVTAVKAFHQHLTQRFGSDGGKAGPMNNAFLTRNPMLPKEYFQSPQVDSFVRNLNEDKPYNLLQCDGEYTVVVRTFSGFNTIVDGKKDKEFVPSGERLDACAASAQEMVKLLRKEGVEAYQYHDRQKSIVTIGSFDQLGRELPDGGFQYAPGILAVMDEYRAFNLDPKLANHVKQKTTQGVPVKCVAEKYPFDVQPIPIKVPKVSKRSLYSAR